MTNHRRFATGGVLLVLPLLLVAGSAAQSKKSKYTCDEPNPQSLCNAGNTCGSPTAPCEVDVRKSGYGATATPQITGAKANKLFCVRPGTTVNWSSTQKNAGFVVDVSDSSPFDPGGPIIGGGSRTVTVVAKTGGCYKYSVGACISGIVSGMCGNSTGELIVTQTQ